MKNNNTQLEITTRKKITLAIIISIFVVLGFYLRSSGKEPVVISKLENWDGLIFIIFGIYALLFGYRVLPKNPKNPQKMELWFRKFGKTMKLCGYLLVVLGIAKFVLQLF